jgi:hypothetical protein
MSQIRVKEQDVLLVIDVQNDFCPGGALPVAHGDEVVPIINRLARRFQHVVLTQDWHPSGHGSFASTHPDKAPYDTIAVSYGTQILWPDHCIQATAGAAFHKDLDIPHAELILRKDFVAPSIPIRHFRRMIDGPRRDLPDIYASAASIVSSLPGWRWTSAFATRPKMQRAKVSKPWCLRMLAGASMLADHSSQHWRVLPNWE